MTNSSKSAWTRLGIGLLLVGGALAVVLMVSESKNPPSTSTNLKYRPRIEGLDTGGFIAVIKGMKPWNANATLEEVADGWKNAAPKLLAELEENLQNPGLSTPERIRHLLGKAMT